MSRSGEETSPPAGAPAKASAGSVLQAPRPAITRYRPVVIGAAVLGVLLLVGLGFLIAFGGGHHAPRPAADGLNRGTADNSATPPPVDDRLPANYGELGAAPTGLGPPAPPASAAGAPSSPGAPGAQSPPVSSAQSPQVQEQRAAQISAPFFAGAAGVTAQASAAPVAPMAQVAVEAPGPVAGPPGLSAKEGFLARAAAPTPAYVASLPQPALSPYEVKAGSVIAAALVTGLNSDLPGMIVAQVTQPVFDHRTGRIVLIPQGARLIGKYDSQVGYGQDRVLLVWTRLIYPSGRSVDLGAMTGADVTGAGGLSDRVDTHASVLARAIGLSTLISIGGTAAQNSLSRGSDNLVLQDGASGVASQASQVGQRLVERDLQRAPTLKIRPGFPVRVMVDKDLVLPPEGDAP